MEAGSFTRVLLVEDEFPDALLVQRNLRPANGAGERFDVRHATTLAQGLEQLREDPADVLLVDLCLPDSDGPTTVARLREQDRRVPLVVFTGRGDAEMVARAFEAGADEYLVKDDLHAGLLRRTLRHAIERRRARSGPALPIARDRCDDPGWRLHDLKNLLTSILGNARILQREMHEDAFLRRRADSLLGAARAAADRIRQLCADAEDPPEQARGFELSGFVREVEPVLRAALPEQVELRLELAPDLAPVAAYPEAIRGVLLELVVNAVEAIGDRGGLVEVRTGRALLAASDLAELAEAGKVAPGPFAWLEVRDGGCGFDSGIRARLFERGFTTKGAGRGHGLAQARETLARQRAGLQVRSRSGRGSAFRILLPSPE